MGKYVLGWLLGVPVVFSLSFFSCFITREGLIYRHG